MQKIESQEIGKRMSNLPEALRNKLYDLETDQDLINVFSKRKIIDQNAIESIANTITLVALGFFAKSELLDLIKRKIPDFYQEIYQEIDEKILIPNNLKGADKPWDDLFVDEDLEPKEEQVDFNKEPQKEETAEDILKEIENPTPLVSSSLEILKKNMSANTTYQAQLPTEPAIQSTTVSPPTPETTPSTPAISVMPNKNSLKKEDQMTAKLNQPVTQTEKSTYYKVDPYREQL